MSDKLDTFSVLFVKRNASLRGPTSSEKWNDTIEELSHDLTEINSQWNNRLVPLLDTVPNGEEGNVDNAIDAWTDGLGGSTLLVDPTATNSLNVTYFNTTADRPNTILEQLEDVYTEIDTVNSNIATSITAALPTADEVSIVDSAELYTSTNVEDALEEVMTTANLALEASTTVASTLTPTGTTQTVDFDLGKFQTIDLESASGNVTLTLSNPLPGQVYRILVIQDSAVPLNLIWPATVKWPGGTAPTISVGANAEDFITLVYNGTSYYGTFEQAFA